MRIISWNTNGLRATIKQGNFDNLFKQKADIICLQETKCTPEQVPEEKRNLNGYYSYFNYPKIKKGYSGVAIYTKIKPEKIFYGIGIKTRPTEQSFGRELDDEGRLLGLKFKNFTLINCYFPNGGQGPDRLKYKLEFYEAFLKFILKLRKNGEKVIFCGDINTAHNEIDLTHPKANQDSTGFLPIERAWIDKVIKNNFIDTYRFFYPNKKEMYTYWDIKTRARERNVGWRLDYFFVDKYFVNKINPVRGREGSQRASTSNGIKKTGMLTNYMGSDHCPIFLDLNI